MAIKITVSNRVKFKVKGTIKDEQGVNQPFDFWLTCLRRNADEVKDLLENASQQTVSDFMASVVEGWEGVRGEDGGAIEYSEARLRELFQIPGIAVMTFTTYFEETSARAKN